MECSGGLLRACKFATHTCTWMGPPNNPPKTYPLLHALSHTQALHHLQEAGCNKGCSCTHPAGCSADRRVCWCRPDQQSGPIASVAAEHLPAGPLAALPLSHCRLHYSTNIGHMCQNQCVLHLEPTAPFCQGIDPGHLQPITPIHAIRTSARSGPDAVPSKPREWSAAHHTHHHHCF